MTYEFSADQIKGIPLVISAPRMATYIAASGDVSQALRLYHWNAQLSSAFLFPLHIFEISVRNAVADAIERYYGQDWMHSTAFEKSLPDPQMPNFSPRRELVALRKRHQSAGKLVADMKFAFWVSMFTARHRGRLWEPRFAALFPNCTAADAEAGRVVVHQATDHVRILRNRIAHHEPIFMRDLHADLMTVLEVIGWRCQHTQEWVRRTQVVDALMDVRPTP